MRRMETTTAYMIILGSCGNGVLEHKCDLYGKYVSVVSSCKSRIVKGRSIQFRMWTFS